MKTSLDSIRAGLFVAPMLFLTFISVSAQRSSGSFQTSALPASAFLSGTGSVNVSSVDRDVNLIFSNPALNGDSLNGWACASYMFYFADIGVANVAYQRNWGKPGTIAIGIQHADLGSIQGYDNIGQPTGEFPSGETIITISKSHQAGNFRLGVAPKVFISSIAGYRATALAVDIGGAFVHPTQQLSVGLVLKNIGIALKEYSTTSSSRLPFDIQVGATYKPAHMPVRFSTALYQIINFDLPGEFTHDEEKVTALEKVLSHFNFGAEVLIHKNVNVLLGYNLLRRYELQLPSGGGSGFSVGVVARINNTELIASRSGFATGGAYQVSLSYNLNKLFY